MKKVRVGIFMMKKINFLIIALLILGVPKVALAFPSMQVYLPGSVAMEYFEVDEQTWVTDGIGLPYSFELIVVANYKNGDISITDGTLLVTVPQGVSGSIGGLGTGTFHSDLTLLPITIPKLKHYPLNKTSDFDYWTFDIGSFAMNTGIHNYDASGGGTMEFNAAKIGEEKTLQITVDGYKYAHFDAYAKFNGSDWRANPGSHDSLVHMPEPASMLLFGLGAVGFGFIRRKRS